MAQVRFPDRTSYVTGFSLLVLVTQLREVFPRVLQFSPLTKNQHLICFDLCWFDFLSPQLVEPLCLRQIKWLSFLLYYYCYYWLSTFVGLEPTWCVQMCSGSSPCNFSMWWTTAVLLCRVKCKGILFYQTLSKQSYTFCQWQQLHFQLCIFIATIQTIFVFSVLDWN